MCISACIFMSYVWAAERKVWESVFHYIPLCTFGLCEVLCINIFKPIYLNIYFWLEADKWHRTQVPWGRYKIPSWIPGTQSLCLPRQGNQGLLLALIHSGGPCKSGGWRWGGRCPGLAHWWPDPTHWASWPLWVQDRGSGCRAGPSAWGSALVCGSPLGGPTIPSSSLLAHCPQAISTVCDEMGQEGTSPQGPAPSSDWGRRSQNTCSNHTTTMTPRAETSDA